MWVMCAKKRPSEENELAGTQGEQGPWLEKKVGSLGILDQNCVLG